MKNIFQYFHYTGFWYKKLNILDGKYLMYVTLVMHI